MMRFAHAVAVVLLASALLDSAPAEAECRFPSINLGSFISGSRMGSRFARVEGGSLLTGSAARYHAVVTGCAADAHYRLMTGAAAPVRVSNGGRSLELVPFIISVNGTPLVTPIDLTHDSRFVLTGNPDLEIVLAVMTDAVDLAPGTYSGGYVMQFSDP